MEGGSVWWVAVVGGRHRGESMGHCQIIGVSLYGDGEEWGSIRDWEVNKYRDFGEFWPWAVGWGLISVLYVEGSIQPSHLPTSSLSNCLLNRTLGQSRHYIPTYLLVA